MSAISSLSLDESQLLQVVLFLAPKCALRLQQVSRSSLFARVASSDPVWERHFKRIFGLDGQAALKGPESEEPTTLQKSFALWCRTARTAGFSCVGASACVVKEDGALHAIQAPLPADWLPICSRMCNWLRTNIPDVLATLRAPLEDPPSMWAELEEDMISEGSWQKEPLLPEVDRCSKVLDLWRLFDGQNAGMWERVARLLDMPEAQDDGLAEGLFGGYAAYNHRVSTIFLPLKSAIRLTAFFQKQLPVIRQHHASKIAFAASAELNKVLLVDTRDGSVHAWRGRQTDDTSLARASPESVSVAGTAGAFQAWLKEYVTRLESGFYTVRPLQPERAPATTGICLFPTRGPEFSQCVTRGVEATASSVHMPESPQGWTYSISFRLVEDEATRGFKTCQLTTRQWEIAEDGRAPDIVNGEGVIGFHPILTDGGWVLNRLSDPHRQYGAPRDLVPGPFTYQSCAGRMASMRGSFGGSLTFVPGTRAKPTGPPFQVKLERFRLVCGDYLY